MHNADEIMKILIFWTITINIIYIKELGEVFKSLVAIQIFKKKMCIFMYASFYFKKTQNF